MSTTIITGRNVSFSIDGDTFDAQATSAILTVESTINTYQTLDGKAYYTTDTQGSFAVEMLADWGAASSLCEMLWNSAATNPNTPLAVVLEAESGSICGRYSSRRTDSLNRLHMRDHTGFRINQQNREKK